MIEKDKFTLLLSDILANSYITYASERNGDAYVVYNDDGVLFSITYKAFQKEYIFEGTNLLKSQYQKYGLPSDAKPNPHMIYDTVAFAYKTYEIIEKAAKDISFIYNKSLIDSDIIFQMRGNFETYVVMNAGIASYAIGYDKKTGKYGFKRYELVKTLYKICGIPEEKKPNYASLYQRAKDYYLAQVAAENIKHLYEF